MSPVIYSDVLHSAKLASWINSLGESKGRQTQEDWSLWLVPATSPLKSSHQETSCGDLSHKQFTQNVWGNKSQGPVSKI